MKRRSWLNFGTVGLALGLALVVAGCSSSTKKPEPAALPPVAGSLAVSKAWTARLGEVSTPLQAVVMGTRVILASSQGQVIELDADTGREVWRQQLNATLIAGVAAATGRVLPTAALEPAARRADADVADRTEVQA